MDADAAAVRSLRRWLSFCRLRPRLLTKLAKHASSTPMIQLGNICGRFSRNKSGSTRPSSGGREIRLAASSGGHGAASRGVGTLSSSVARKEEVGSEESVLAGDGVRAVAMGQ